MPAIVELHTQDFDADISEWIQAKLSLGWTEKDIVTRLLFCHYSNRHPDEVDGVERDYQSSVREYILTTKMETSQ